MYTNDERNTLVWLVIDEKYSLRKAAERFHQLHPNRPVPSPNTISELLKKIRATGSVVNRTKSGRPRSATNENNELMVLASVELKSQQSLKEISHETGVSMSSAGRILRRHKFHPYGVTLVQELSENDFEKREDFCEMMELLIRNDDIAKNICFSDESTFFLNGYVNRHNMRYWCQENPHEFRVEHTQTPLKSNVWAGILGGRIIGPFFIDGNLNGEKYLNLLQDSIVPAMVDAAEDQNIDFDEVYFQQDGAPAHYARAVRDFLDETFPGRWIGRGGPLPWPARSPDLTPLDFFLWGFLKDRVFRTKPANLIEMRDRIVENCLLPDEDMLNRVLESFKSRLFVCMEQEGKQFEHLL